MESNEQGFDLEAVYDAEIAPLMTKIIEVCKTHKMPMFATFLYMNDPADGSDGVCTTNLMFDKERPVPECMLKLEPSIRISYSALRMRVTRGDGTAEDTVILGLAQK
jgi:hypothetical protein